MATIITPPSPDSESSPPQLDAVAPGNDSPDETAPPPFHNPFQSPSSNGSALYPANAASQSPGGASSLLPRHSPGLDDNGQPGGPFNFTPMSMTKSPVMKSSVGQRRGHRYKHSSVSHSIFQEPTPRAPISIPNSLPIPDLSECRRSMSREQNVRFWWSICHAVVAAYTLWSASGSLAQTALSHLLLFDALGAMLCVAVDVLENFEVWKRSSIKHPFGLERAEVLAGFATSVLLVFMGMDLISHNIQHILEELGGHEPHFEHEHEHISTGEVSVVVLLAIASTAISAAALKNHARIGKVMRLAYLDSLPSILSNPSHLLTITCSCLLFALPMLSSPMYTTMDRALSLSVAGSMFLLGTRLLFKLGPILLMSYSGPSTHTVLRDIESDPAVLAVEEAKFWQVHYGLCMANLKLRVRGTEETLARLRERLSSLVKNRLGGGYGTGGQRWEVSTQLITEND